MKKALFAAAFLFFTTNPSAFAQTHTPYCDMAASTAAQKDCIKKHNAAAQEALNKVYEGLSARLDEDSLKQLRALQQSWIDYRDSECAWESGQTGSDGALAKMKDLSCKTVMTENRAALLSSLSADDTFANLSDLSGFPRWMNALTEDYPDVFWQVGQRVRADLDCDGTQEIVMMGVSMPSPQAQDVVIAVTKNVPAGRPATHSFRLPVVDDPALTPSVCSHKISLKFIPPSKNTGDNEDQNVCDGRIEIVTKSCPSASLVWTGKTYDLQFPADAAAKSEQP